MLMDVVNLNKKTYVKGYLDMHFQKLYLEGTGVLIFDTINQKVYVNLSPRADIKMLETFMNDFNSQIKEGKQYSAHTFKAFNGKNPIYHTNVMLGILSKHAVVSLDTVKSKEERSNLEEQLSSKEKNAKPKKLIKISIDEVNNFCGNVL